MIKVLYGLIVLLLVVLVITKPYISVTESTFNYGELGRKKNIIEQIITGPGDGFYYEAIYGEGCE